MNIENQLRESLQEKGKELIPSPELKVKVMSNITTPVKEKIKRRIVTGILTALLLIPTTAFAYQTFLADELYGSFEHVKKHISSATMEGYYLLNAKLLQAKGELVIEEYEQFKELLNVITSSKIAYADKYGSIDYAQVSSEKVEEIKQALIAIQPYFDKLNGLQSSKEVLTFEEYVKYIEALMSYEKVLAQSGINPSDGPIEREMILPHLQEEFVEAKDYIWYVDDKQLQ